MGPACTARGEGHYSVGQRESDTYGPRAARQTDIGSCSSRRCCSAVQHLFEVGERGGGGEGREIRIKVRTAERLAQRALRGPQPFICLSTFDSAQADFSPYCSFPILPPTRVSTSRPDSRPRTRSIKDLEPWLSQAASA